MTAPAAHLRRVQRRVNGRMHVRAYQLAEILGVRRAQLNHWERLGKIKPLRIKVPSSRENPGGLLCYILVSDAMRLARWRADGRYRPWTDEEVRRLRGMICKQSLAEIGRRLGRTTIAVKTKAQRLGISRVWNGGMLTTTQAGDLLGVNRHTIQRWANEGKLDCYRPTPIRGDRRIPRQAVEQHFDTEQQR